MLRHAGSLFSPLRAGLFIAIVAGPVFGLAYGGVIANAIVDPLWFLPQQGERSWMRYCIDDERTNKINRATFGGQAFDGLLLGSSRSAFVDTHKFQGERVFNMSVNGMRPVEFAAYLAIFARHNEAPRSVYVGFDFFGFVREEGDAVWVPRAQERERTAMAPFYRLSRLFDVGTLWTSIRTIVRCSSPGYGTVPTHRYDGVRDVRWSEKTEAFLAAQETYFVETIFDRRHALDPEFRDRLRALRDVAGTARIVPYVLPTTDRLFLALVRNGRLQDYLDFLRILVEIFGSVRQFGGLNDFATTPSNFYDLHHIYPDLSGAIVAQLEGRTSATADGFGALLTAETFAAYSEDLRRRVRDRTP